MTAKERITLYVSTNATGERVSPAAIGASQQPCCFRTKKPPSEYIRQDNAWFKTRTMKD